VYGSEDQRHIGRTYELSSEDDFDVVKDRVCIIVQDEAVLALNVPPWDVDQQEIYTLVFFDRCWKLGFDALVGLIAYELAHTWVDC
jgi:hypothetical protein